MRKVLRTPENVRRKEESFSKIRTVPYEESELKRFMDDNKGIIESLEEIREEEYLRAKDSVKDVVIGVH